MYAHTLQDNIQQFLKGCHTLGLKDAQLFDTTDLQEPKGAKVAGYTISMLCTYNAPYVLSAVPLHLMSDGLMNLLGKPHQLVSCVD